MRPLQHRHLFLLHLSHPHHLRHLRPRPFSPGYQLRVDLHGGRLHPQQRQLDLRSLCCHVQTVPGNDYELHQL